MEKSVEGLSLIESFFNEFNNESSPGSDECVQHRFRFIGSFRLKPEDVEGEVFDWVMHYLEKRKCPHSLAVVLSRAVTEEVSHEPELGNFQTAENPIDECETHLIDAVQLHSQVIQLLHELIQYWEEKYQEMASTTVWPCSPIYNVSVCAIKNTRRKMEDRHVILHDLNVACDLQDVPHHSYYAVFDGHAGTEAANFAAAHLHWNIVQHPAFFTDTQTAIKEAFKITDKLFLERAFREGMKSGCTAVCCLAREKTLYLAWLGDSQAIVVRQGIPLEIMSPHKPDREDERHRIENEGGCVLFIGTWRVNGTLAVSRALGDPEHKPCVSCEPDVITVNLDGTEDFLVLACDGLWDRMTPSDVIKFVYHYVKETPNNLESLASQLVHQAKDKGSSDNITTIVAFLRDPADLANSPMPPIPIMFPQLQGEVGTINGTTISSGTTVSGHVSELWENVHQYQSQNNQCKIKSQSKLSICDKINTNEPEEIYQCIDTSDIPERTELGEVPTPPINEVMNIEQFGMYSEEVEKAINKVPQKFDASFILDPGIVNIQQTPAKESPEVDAIMPDNHVYVKEVANEVVNLAIESAVDEVQRKETEMSITTTENDNSGEQNYMNKMEFSSGQFQAVSELEQPSQQTPQSKECDQSGMILFSAEDPTFTSKSGQQSSNSLPECHQTLNQDPSSMSELEQPGSTLQNEMEQSNPTHQPSAEQLSEKEEFTPTSPQETDQSMYASQKPEPENSSHLQPKQALPILLEAKQHVYVPQSKIDVVPVGSQLENSAKQRTEPIGPCQSETELLFPQTTNHTTVKISPPEIVEDKSVLELLTTQQLIASNFLVEPQNKTDGMGKPCTFPVGGFFMTPEIYDEIELSKDTPTDEIGAGSAVVELGAIPDSVPEAEGVTEDVDSDSEKDGGWKYVKGDQKSELISFQRNEEREKVASHMLGTTSKPISKLNTKPNKLSQENKSKLRQLTIGETTKKPSSISKPEKIKDVQQDKAKTLVKVGSTAKTLLSKEHKPKLSTSTIPRQGHIPLVKKSAVTSVSVPSTKRSVTKPDVSMNSKPSQQPPKQRPSSAQQSSPTNAQKHRESSSSVNSSNKPSGGLVSTPKTVSQKSMTLPRRTQSRPPVISKESDVLKSSTLNNSASLPRHSAQSLTRPSITSSRLQPNSGRPVTMASHPKSTCRSPNSTTEKLEQTKNTPMNGTNTSVGVKKARPNLATVQRSHCTTKQSKESINKEISTVASGKQQISNIKLNERPKTASGSSNTKKANTLQASGTGTLKTTSPSKPSSQGKTSKAVSKDKKTLKTDSTAKQTASEKNSPIGAIKPAEKTHFSTMPATDQEKGSLEEHLKEASLEKVEIITLPSMLREESSATVVQEVSFEEEN
ncbi:uncharacterized protein LOC106468763 isoform X2 [Limulus polyphemus]|uniref:Uncharacterized protein LOC106468763 isoform X2 n=1 Tax=Limulus polyphemus TaxID=6850 RepID=A0ABM1TAC6_LIMPO|nr:uncharacterized protein LOC106468763 isoform X2 [Limulus polyphemus]